MLLFLLLHTLFQEPGEDVVLVEPEFKVDYEERVVLVDLPLKVTRFGRPVTELERGDLVIKENGIEAEIRKLTQVQTELTVHLLLDLSTSNAEHIFQTKAASRHLIKQLKKGDKAKVSYFSNTYQELSDYTDDQDFLLKKLSRVTPIGSTALYDGLSAALDQLSEVSGSRVLFLFSDGHDLMSGTTEEELATKVKNYRIPIFMVSFKASGKELPPLLAEQRQFMSDLVRDSGGHLFLGNTQFQNDLTQAMRQTRTRFLINYTSPNTSNGQTWRSIMATHKSCDDCYLEYRRGYELSRTN
ncbi:VWA domain-containing protein [Sulfidibacter corallicola]|uniref:VWA domain-containing protein n=1 Tax=Sulfidibacter corallicola TaxID=2818388 RepID=A0A8A4TVT1_SULCO|nr:VWA domain-containing protein [Sulfidibacter corallicola]QTD53261.1 VWA domain-containing protein [Sulfidibacter corallicola]